MGRMRLREKVSLKLLTCSGAFPGLLLAGGGGWGVTLQFNSESEHCCPRVWRSCASSTLVATAAKEARGCGLPRRQVHIDPGRSRADR